MPRAPTYQELADAVARFAKIAGHISKDTRCPRMTRHACKSFAAHGADMAERAKMKEIHEPV
jgi:hypothetical protein